MYTLMEIGKNGENDENDKEEKQKKGVGAIVIKDDSLLALKHKCKPKKI